VESLFRLALLRPPIAQDPDHPSIELEQGSAFQKKLAAALKNDDKRSAALAVARAYIGSALFVGDPAQNDLAKEIAAFDSSLATLKATGEAGRKAVRNLIQQSFGAAAADVVKTDPFKRALERARDSIIAIKFVQEEHSRPIEELARQLRDLELVVRVAADAAFPRDADDMRRHCTRSLRLPGQVGLGSVLSSSELERKRKERAATAEAQRRRETTKLLDRYRTLTTAVDELASFHASDLRTTLVQVANGVDLPATLQPTGVLKDRVGFASKLSAATLKRLNIPAKGQEPPPAAPIDGAAAELAATALSATQRLLAGKPGFQPPDVAEIGFHVTPEATARLSKPTAAVLAERGIDLGVRALDRSVMELRGELDLVREQLHGVFSDAQRTSVKRIGTALVSIKTPLTTAWTDVVFGGGLPPGIELEPPEDPRIPHTRGEVKPAGVADLLVVKQQLVRYEGTDVAHIENVLRGERKAREHTRRRETEEITFVETEVTTTEERELESTSRFELSRETSTTIQEDASLKAGLTLSGKYGPTVEFSASAEGSISRSKEEATKTAASFSQDVTERSSRKVTERILERSSLRVTNEVIEKDEHILDNTAGGGHISGVYQWVNKVYQAQMFNYGLRTMFDFMIPEPAAMLIQVMQSAHASETALTKPPPFTLQPDQVTESNYGYWVKVYGATDVEPPPELYQTVALDYSAGNGDDKTDYNHSGQLNVPEGYQAIFGTVGAVTNSWEAAASLDLVLGRRVQRIGGSTWLWSTSLDNEVGAVPFGLNTWRISDIAAAVEVKCQRTARALKHWAADTHAKLTNAYRARLEEYEEQLAQLELQAGVAIEGQNPAANLLLMKDELKKHCISVLTDQHFDLFDAVDTGYYGLAQIDVFEAAGEGPYVRFFEQAMEWEHMTWLTYPYFWGRKSQWDERLGYEDPDPLFNELLKAGYCRVSVPARPGFEGAIDHFMTFGELWNGGPLPAVSSPLYLPIADEIAERLDRPGAEVPQGDPWLVRIPTTLVKLRPDDRLPEWEQDAEGNWVEKA
jgi:hypothetical protein